MSDISTAIPFTARPKPATVPPGVSIVARIHIRRGDLWAELPGDFKRLVHCEATIGVFRANHPASQYEVRFHAVDTGRAG